MTSLQDGFNKTITSFKNHLTRNELEQVHCSSLAELQVVIGRIQSYQRDQKQMMNLTRIKSFLEAMAQFEQIVNVFLNVNDFVAFIWGPIKFLLQVASTWSDAFDMLLDAYEKIGEHIPLLQQYQSLFENSPRMHSVLILMYSDITEFHQRAIRFFADKVWKQIFKSAWKTFQTRFAHILDALARHKQLIESQARVLHFQQYQGDRMQVQDALNRIEDAVRQHQLELRQVCDAAEQVEADQCRGRRYEVLQWLCSNDNIITHEAACKARAGCAGSGTWVLKETKVHGWRSTDVSSHNVLWLDGIPGAGKSVLASVVIEDCLERKDCTTAYYYCTSSDSQRNTCLAVLRGMISQLQAQCDELLPYCHEKMHASGDTILSSLHTAKSLLKLFCERLSNVFLIVDGLDECSETERRVLVDCLIDLIDSTPGGLRLLVVSQAEGDIKKLLSTADRLTITLEHNADDIRSYVNSRMVKVAKTYEMEAGESDHAVHLTCAGASGMFLFARLVMDNLAAQPTKEDLYKELSRSVFPTDLRGAYERIINRIRVRTENKPAMWDAAVKLLGWMTCAKRPLRRYEIQAVQCINPQDQQLQFDAKKFRFDVQVLCGSLMIELPGDRLSLVHGTARQYILETKFISHVQVEGHLTALCLEYLIFPAFNDSQTEDSLRDLANTGQLAFHDYSVANWTYHILALAAAGKEASTEANVWFESAGVTAELEIALECFMQHYEDDLQDQEIDNSAEDACSAFAALPWYDDLKLLWSLSKRHSSSDLETRNKVCLSTLGHALKRSRNFLEMTSKDEQGGRRLNDNFNIFYGKNHFKCPKVTCFWFHEGFTEHKTRQTHVSRHERPFRCEAANCSAQDYGLKTAKDLEKHTMLYHPALDQQSVVLFTTARATPTKTPFACHLCEKRYTRKYHLTSHIRNHNKEKPFPCSECGKAFTRANDRKRHVKIHSRRG